MMSFLLLEMDLPPVPPLRLCSKDNKINSRTNSTAQAVCEEDRWLDACAIPRKWSTEEHLTLSGEIDRLRQYADRERQSTKVVRVMFEWMKHHAWPAAEIIKYLVNLALESPIHRQRLSARWTGDADQVAEAQLVHPTGEPAVIADAQQGMPDKSGLHPIEGVTACEASVELEVPAKGSRRLKRRRRQMREVRLNSRDKRMKAKIIQAEQTEHLHGIAVSACGRPIRKCRAVREVVVHAEQKTKTGRRKVTKEERTEQRKRNLDASNLTYDEMKQGVDALFLDLACASFSTVRLALERSLGFPRNGLKSRAEDLRHILLESSAKPDVQELEAAQSDPTQDFSIEFISAIQQVAHEWPPHFGWVNRWRQ